MALLNACLSLSNETKSCNIPANQVLLSTKQINGYLIINFLIKIYESPN